MVLQRILFPIVKSAFRCSSSFNCGINLLYFGNDSFSSLSLVPLLERLRHSKDGKLSPELTPISNIEVVYDTSITHKGGIKVLTDPALLETANVHHLKTHLWQDVLHGSIELEKFSLGIVASFGKLLPKEVIHRFQYGALNAHPSLLPRWKGAAPIMHTVLNGDRDGGVSIIDLSVNRFDDGNIYYQTKMKVPSNSTTSALTVKLADLAGHALLHVLDNFDDLHKKRFKQDAASATSAHKVSPKMGKIIWGSMSSWKIDCMSRAFESKIPLYTFFCGKKVKLVDISGLEGGPAAHEESRFQPGQGFFDTAKSALLVKCQVGWVQIDTLRFDNRKPITAKDFANGYTHAVKDNTVLPSFSFYTS